MSFCFACCMMRSAGIGKPWISESFLTSMSTGEVRFFGLGASSGGVSGLASSAAGFFSASAAGAAPPPAASPPAAPSPASAAGASSTGLSSTRGGGVKSGQANRPPVALP